MIHALKPPKPPFNLIGLSITPRGIFLWKFDNVFDQSRLTGWMIGWLVKSLKNRGMRLAPALCSDWLNTETVNLSAFWRLLVRGLVASYDLGLFSPQDFTGWPTCTLQACKVQYMGCRCLYLQSPNAVLNNRRLRRSVSAFLLVLDTAQ